MGVAPAFQNRTADPAAGTKVGTSVRVVVYILKPPLVRNVQAPQTTQQGPQLQSIAQP